MERVKGIEPSYRCGLKWCKISLAIGAVSVEGHFGRLDDRKMAQFARKYGVSVQAMTNRLVSLGFIYDGDLP
jgi:hypothetical protein